MIRPSVTAVLVGYDGPVDAVARAVASLDDQITAPEQIVCVDQSPDGRFAAHFAGRADVQFLRPEFNLGYSSACNRAVQIASGEYVLFLNPDAIADRACVQTLAETLHAAPQAAIAGAQILLPDGATVNAGDNRLHLSGLSWAGRYGLPVEHGPARPAAAASGAALMVRRSHFTALGGYTEGFFMYYDDVDLAWRARLRGWEVLFCPQATVSHDYAFAKGGYKWRWLERNRWWCLLAHLQVRTLLLLAPLLVAVELAILARARQEGWLSDKLGSYRTLWRARAALRARRREIQTSRVVGDRAILQRMTAVPDTPFLELPAWRGLAPLLRAYRSLLLALAR